MRDMPYTTAQTAKGILSTFNRGDYSLAASRVKQAPEAIQEEIILTVKMMMTKEQRVVFNRYLKYQGLL